MRFSASAGCGAFRAKHTRAGDRSFCRRAVSADTVPTIVHQDRLTVLKYTLINAVFSDI
jgi:hypothetical protein